MKKQKATASPANPQDEKLKKQLLGVMLILSLFIILLSIGIFIEKKPMSQPARVLETEDMQNESIEESQFTLAEVAEHNTPESCWIVVSGRVYDISEYVLGGTHPGGTQALTEGCGAVSTSFERIHSPNAKSALEQFFVGVLVE